MRRVPFGFFQAAVTPDIYTLSLYDALPISGADGGSHSVVRRAAETARARSEVDRRGAERRLARRPVEAQPPTRSEEHTSELQSLTNLVCRLLLEKKKACCALSSRIADCGPR